MKNIYYKTMYSFLSIYKKYHISYRYFKKASIKRYNAYKKMLKEAYEEMEAHEKQLKEIKK